MQNKKFVVSSLSLIGIFLFAFFVSAHQPRLVKPDMAVMQVKNPELSQAFYDELQGFPRRYTISSDSAFNLYVNLLVPKSSNPQARYSAEIYKDFETATGALASSPELIAFLSATSTRWTEFYEEFASDTYLKGPEFEAKVDPGDYEIIVSNADNQGKYVLAVGKKEEFGPKSIFDAFYILPLLKVNFFHTSVFRLLFPAKLGIMYWVALVILVLIIVAIRYKLVKKRVQKQINN